MTHRRDINASHARLTPDAVSEFLTILTSAENPLSGILVEVLNAAMLLERQHHLRADLHERTDERNGYANGYKDRTLKIRLGTIELSVCSSSTPWKLLVDVVDRAHISKPALSRRPSNRALAFGK